MSDFNSMIGAANDFIWADWTLYVLLLEPDWPSRYGAASARYAAARGTELLLSQSERPHRPGHAAPLPSNT